MTLPLGAYTKTALTIVQSVCCRLPPLGRGRGFGDFPYWREKAHLRISIIPMTWATVDQTNICFLYVFWVTLCQDRMGVLCGVMVVTNGMCIHYCDLIQGTICGRVSFLIKLITSGLFSIISNIVFHFLIFRTFSKNLKVCSFIALKELERNIDMTCTTL